jgi:hypothetical protein
MPSSYPWLNSHDCATGTAGKGAMSMSSDEELDDTQVRFQEAHGARLFRQGKPRALLEVKSPNIPTAIYEAPLRGYDRAKTAKERS